MTTPPLSLRSPAEPRPGGDRAGRSLGEVGMWVFLASLAMLFLGGAVGYVVIRLQLNGIRAEKGESPLPAVDLPALLWVSTAAILASSAILHLAGMRLSSAPLKDTRRLLLLAAGFALAFLAAQAPCLWHLLSEHFARLGEVGKTGGVMHGLVFTLILIHALHLVGGIFPFARVLHSSARDDFKSRGAQGLKLLTMYWHFLDGVWIILFATLLLTP